MSRYRTLIAVCLIAAALGAAGGAALNASYREAAGMCGPENTGCILAVLTTL